MTSDDVVRLFADETPVRAFAAVALGARSTAEAVERTGLTAKDAVGALRRLEDRAVVVSDDGGLTVSYDHFRGLARAAAGSRIALHHLDRRSGVYRRSPEDAALLD